jgi:hypothetical protein
MAAPLLSFSRVRVSLIVMIPQRMLCGASLSARRWCS